MESPHALPPNHPLGDTERLKRIMDEFRAGYEVLESLGKAVTYFGSHVTPENDPMYGQATKLAAKMAHIGYATVTGGGPGIMEAVNRGAAEAGGRSVGFSVTLEDQEPRNMYVHEGVTFYYLFVRKVMLASAGHAYVFFPGGFGSFDEFFEITTLIHTHKLHQDIPIVLMGHDFWDPLIDWMQKTVITRYHMFENKDLFLWQIVDTADEAFAYLQEHTASVRLYF